MLGWSLYAVKVNGGSAFTIDQITDQQINPGITEILEGSGSNVLNEFVSVGAQDPRVTFTSTAIVEALDGIGTTHAIAIGPAEHTSVDLYFRKRTEGGAFDSAATATHVKMTVSKGLFYWSTLQAAQGGNATLAMELVCLYDGTNDPVIVTSNTAHESLGNHTDLLWTLGPAYVNSVSQLDGVTNISVESGIQVEVTPSGGEIWSQTCHIASRAPTMKISTLDVSQFSTLGILGAIQGGNATKGFFRRRQEGAGLELDASGVHVRVQMDQGRVSVSQAGGSERQNATAELQITPTSDDGVNLPLIINTAAAVA